MADLSVLDLQNLRHLIGGYDTSHCKMTEYASQTEDPGNQKIISGCGKFRKKNKQDLNEIFIRRVQHVKRKNYGWSTH